MQRILSILLAVVVGLGAFLSGMPANALANGHSGLSGWTGKVDESHIPACCRRNGAHHCMMDTIAKSGETSISSSDCCPCMPHALASVATQIAALATERISNHLAAEEHSPQQAVISAGISARRTWPKRGPPSRQSL